MDESQRVGRVANVLLLLCAFGLAVVASASRSASAAEPVHVEKGVAQLFVDDYLVDAEQGLQRTLHQPVKDHGGREPVIRAEPGTTLLAYGSIVYDTRLQRYVMFVQGFVSREMLRFTSADGLVWTPASGEPFETVHFDLDLEPGLGARGRPGIDLFSCYYDTKDRAFPYKGWLYFANYGFDGEGIYYVRSADGLKWERGRQVVNAWAGPGDTSAQRIDQDGKTVFGPGDVTLFYHDAQRDRFLGIFKFFTSDAVPPGNDLRSRAYLWLDRMDEPVDTSRIKRIALLPPAAEVGGDMPYDEYYASTAWRYASLWLGGLKVWHSKGDYPYSAAGCAFLKLVVSRDGLDWHKVPFRNDAGVAEVFIPNGPEGGNGALNDGGYISEFSQGPLRVGDELIYYYSASSWGKNQARDTRIRGGGIFRARLRVDGFVSVTAGTLTTRPLAFEGEELCVNAVGPVEIAVLDRDREPVARARVQGDSLAHRVAFDSKTLRGLMPGGVCRLQFAVPTGSRLYAFTIR